MKISDIKTEDMARTGELANLLRKGHFDLSLPEIIQAEKALTWLSQLGKDMAEIYKKEVDEAIKEPRDEPPKPAFTIKQYQPSASSPRVKTK